MTKKSFYIQPLKLLTDRLDSLIQGRLWMKVLVALALGIALGLLLGPDLGWFRKGTVDSITAWLALPGQVFLSLIQMIVVPLVVASIVRGLASNNDPAALKKIGLIAVLFIVFTTVVATSIGIGLGIWVSPGSYIQADALMESGLASVAQAPATGFPTMSELPDKVLSVIPRNPLSSMVSGEMLQVILFSAVLGLALLSIPRSQAQPLFDLLGALQDVSLQVVSWAMKLAPLAVFGLITKLVANLGMDVLAGMLMYVVTVVAGLLLMAVFYLVLLRWLAAQPVHVFLSKTKELLLLAFSTSSSAAVMPLTLKVTENELGVKPEYSRFLVPLGATINMTGTALYQGAATVFLAQVFQVDLSLTSYIFVVTMAVAASVGSPATPGAGIVILSMVLEGVGIPAAGIALLLGVDRILDMLRTTTNVLGDVSACLVVQKVLSKSE